MSQINPTSSFEFNNILYKSYDEALRAKKRHHLSQLPGWKTDYRGYRSSYDYNPFPREYREERYSNPIDFIMNNKDAILDILREGR